MAKLFVFGLALIAMGGSAYAGWIAPTPGPLLGAVAGPWGLVASGIAYATYRLYRARS